MTSKAQLKENASLLDVLRQKYAEQEDYQLVKAAESLITVTSEALHEANSDARELIKSKLNLLPSLQQS